MIDFTDKDLVILMLAMADRLDRLDDLAARDGQENWEKDIAFAKALYKKIADFIT